MPAKIGDVYYFVIEDEDDFDICSLTVNEFNIKGIFTNMGKTKQEAIDIYRNKLLKDLYYKLWQLYDMEAKL